MNWTTTMWRKLRKFSAMAGIAKPNRQANVVGREWIAAYFSLSAPGFGDSSERNEIHHFANRLADEIERSGAGQYDGDEFGGGECGLFMNGPDADRLFDVVYPILVGWSKMKGGRVIKRYGSKDRQETIAMP